MDKGKAVVTHDSSSGSSSSEDVGLVTREQRRERLNMPRVSVVSARDQVEVDHEFIKKLLEEERLKGFGLMEVPGDKELAQRLQEDLHEAE